MWDLSCPDWEGRIRDGLPPIPELPLLESEAELGLRFFDEIQLPDVPEKPRLGDAAGSWFRALAKAVFGSWDPEQKLRFIRDFFVLAPKGQSKTSYSAGLMLAVMLMNRRPRAEALFIGPTQAISDRAYEQAVGMIDESPDLKRRFRPRDHIKTIEDLLNHSEMKVKTFDVNILTGSILIFALLDELHLLGRNAHTTKVIRQIRGGLEKTPEGALLITTTQSDDAPAGAFKDELLMARKIRDGAFRGQVIRPTLTMLYEFPEGIAKDPLQWQDPSNWPLVMPNLGRSVQLGSLIADWQSEKSKGEHAIRVWASQHLNIEIGVGIKTDHWPGARFWEVTADRKLNDLKELLERSEVVVVGIDGGGLDDLLGLTVIGREKGTRDWLSWSKAWAHQSVIELRKGEESRLRDFESAGDLMIVDRLGEDIDDLVQIVAQVSESGLLAEISDRKGIGLDPVCIGQIIDALVEADIIENDEQVIGVTQGWKLAGAIKTAERKLADGSMYHADQALMDWCVGNARLEQKGNAVLITKQVSGSGKIDPLMALFNAVALMSMNPETTRLAYEDEDHGLMVL